jgi:hypothetical protein
MQQADFGPRVPRAALAAALAFTLITGGAAQTAAGDQAPDFEIETALNGATSRLADLDGKAVLLDLFATW